MIYWCMKECYTKPTCYSSVKRIVADYVMFVDENGCASQVKSVSKALIDGKEVSINDRYFTLTGCLFEVKNYKKAIESFALLKNKYWENGKFDGEIVNLHSREIRRREKAFGALSEKFDDFMRDLSLVLQDAECKVISITVDIVEYIKQGKKNNIYCNGFYLLIERYIYATQNHKKGIIIFEERGWQEDNELLKEIDLIVNVYGAKHISSKELQSKISGVFFSTKRKSISERTSTGLEIADLFSYPIHKFVRNGTKDKSFLVVEKKIDGYPNYMNKGLKIFPQPK